MHMVSKVTAGLILASALFVAVPGAQAETQTENIVAEQRTYVYLEVAPNAAQAFLPAGWTVNPPEAGVTKGANLIVLFLDRKLGLTPDGKPLQAGTNRLLVLIIPSKNAKTGEAANMIVGGYSADPQGVPGAYRVYGAGTVSVHRIENGSGGKLDNTVDETWFARGDDGSEVDFHVAFTRGLPTLGSFDVHNYSAAEPTFYRIYRGDQIVDTVKSVNSGIDRAQGVALKASGNGKLASAINGSEKIVAINSMPFYRRLTFLP
jgi:hypothetical protein